MNTQIPDTQIPDAHSYTQIPDTEPAAPMAFIGGSDSQTGAAASFRVDGAGAAAKSVGSGMDFTAGAGTSGHMASALPLSDPTSHGGSAMSINLSDSSHVQMASVGTSTGNTTFG